jgi:hypothetical protein
MNMTQNALSPAQVWHGRVGNAGKERIGDAVMHALAPIENLSVRNISCKETLPLRDSCILVRRMISNHAEERFFLGFAHP